MPYLDVIIPGPWWNSLTYLIDAGGGGGANASAEKFTLPPDGARVRVPVKNSARVGFAVGAGGDNERAGNNIECKKIIEVIDNEPVFGETLWKLALWVGHYFMCGPGEVLKVISPPRLLSGEPIPQPLEVLGERSEPGKKEKYRKFCESECYLPYDSERENFYINRLIELEDDDAALVLFPERSSAKRFYNLLPAELKDNAMLWEGMKTESHWRNWLDVRAGNVKFVIGGPSAVFAPLSKPSVVIVDDEANPAYVSARYPNLPARSVAGQLALISGAELILGGRLPSAKTYFRKKIKCNFLPDKDLLHFVDIKGGFSASIQGVEKTLPISGTLVSETKKCLNEDMTALWIFDRKGYATEVLCENCGSGLFCSSCGAVMTAENDVSEGEIVLCCRRCSNRKKLPEFCPVCRGKFFVGKRPGLEALQSIAGAFCEQELKGAAEGKKEKTEQKLVVGTRKILSLCDKKNIGLVAWIDIDLEAHKTDYASRFHAFSMVWESLWRGVTGTETSDKIKGNKNRRVIIQSRNPARGWQAGLKSGWEYFWDRELAERTELEFPPYKPLVEIEVSARESERLLKLLEENGYMAMNSSAPHDGKHYIWLSASPLSALEKVLSPRFSISKSRYGYPRVRILVE